MIPVFCFGKHEPRRNRCRLRRGGTEEQVWAADPSPASGRIEAQLWNYSVECLDKNLTQAEFLDASIQHNSPLGHAYQDAPIPFPAFSGASIARTACTSAPSKPSKTSRPRPPPDPPSSHPNSSSSPPTHRFPNRHPPCPLNHLSRQLASFRRTPLHPANRRI